MANDKFFKLFKNFTFATELQADVIDRSHPLGKIDELETNDIRLMVSNY